MKLTDLLKDIEIGKVYTDKDKPPFTVKEEKCNCNCHRGKIEEKFNITPPAYSSGEAKTVVDDALRNYAKELRKLQYKVIKDWMSKAKSGVIDYFDLVRGFQSGNASRAYPYETKFLMSILSKDKVIDRFRKYFGGKKGKKR